MMPIARVGRLFFVKHSPRSVTWWAEEARNLVRHRSSHAAAASLPSDTPKRKRVSKDERRAMIVSYVDRYRSSNAGKFPSASAVQKEVGGSYYVVKKLLQELEYKSKVCSSNSCLENLSGKVVDKGDGLFSEAEMVSTAVRVQNDSWTEAIDDVKMIDSEEKKLEAEGLQVHTSPEDKFSEDIQKPQTPGSRCDFDVKESNVLKDNAKSLEKPEDDILEDSGTNRSDKFPVDLDKQKIVGLSGQHLESAEGCKSESLGVQSDFAGAEDDPLRAEIEVRNADSDRKEQTASAELPSHGGPVLKAEHQQQSPVEEKDSDKKEQTASAELPSHGGSVLKAEHQQQSPDEEKDSEKKEQTASAELPSHGGPVLKAELQQQSPDEEKDARNSSSEQSNNAEASTKPSLWGNFKSFADGIINIWRKL